jgi:RES domain-containing protein
MVGVTRQRVVQNVAPHDLTGFPNRTYDGFVYRVARFAPWWFCTCGDCRFDLEANSRHGQGTMYAGTDEITGVLETIGPELNDRPITRQFLTERNVWALAYDRAVIIADLTADEAVGYGVTNELSTMVAYAISQSWANAFQQQGWDGISYRTRFNTAATTTGVALFDDAGSHPRWPALQVCGADDPAIVAELNRRHIKVEDPPVVGSLTVL